jgi:hypothetical protein
MCEWGPHVEKLELIYAETGVRPKAYDNFPPLDACVQEILEVFQQLSATRTVGFQMNPIQLSEMRSHFDMYGPPSVGVQIAVRLLVRMDQKFLALKSGSSAPTKKA